ncbi:hypothetical protein ACFY36_32115 [Actinoplanes sp. NPDC000266]
MVDDPSDFVYPSQVVKDFAAAVGLPEPGPWTREEWDEYQAAKDRADACLAEIIARRNAATAEFDQSLEPGRRIHSYGWMSRDY